MLIEVLRSVMICSLVLLTLWWCKYQWTNRRMLKALRKLPTLFNPLPIIGHAHYTVFGLERVTGWLIQFSEQAITKGLNTVCIWFGPFPMLVVYGQEDMQKILNGSTTSEKSELYDLANYILGKGLITAPHHTWKITRRHMNSLFHPRNLEQLVPVFNTNSRELVSILSGHVGKGPVNVVEHTMSIGLKTICGLIFGPEIHFDINSKEFLGLKSMMHKFMEMFIVRISRIWLRSDTVYSFLYKKELQEIDRLWKEFTKNPLQTAQMKRSQQKEDQCAMYEGGEEMTTNGGTGEILNLIDVYDFMQKKFPEFTENELKEEMKTMYVAGTDTTALLTAYCLLAIAHHQDVQERLYQEIISVVGPEGDITTQDILKMPYLDQVYKESLRWGTVVPFVARRTTEVLSLSTCTVPAGCDLAVSLIGLHMDPKTFPNPKVFDPDRFGPGSPQGKEKNSFLPFSGGPRNCIGKKYAEIFMKIMVIHVLRRYKLATNMDIYNLKRKFIVTLINSEGYNISLDNRG